MDKPPTLENVGNGLSVRSALSLPFEKQMINRCAGNMKHFPTYVFLVILVFVSGPCSMAQIVRQRLPVAGHRGAVNAIVNGGGTILSAGEDGFLQKWNVRSGVAEDRFQISALPLKAMVARPGKTEVAVIESDGKQHLASVWDFSGKSKLFSVSLQREPNFIGYSDAGAFLFIAQSDNTRLLCLDSVSGEVVQSIDVSGAVNLAATGRSERNAVLYQNSGVISYWNMADGGKIQERKTVSNLLYPILAGNNRFLCGVSADSGNRGLFVIDAVSGGVLDYNSALTQGRLYQLDSASSEFICISPQTEEPLEAKDGRPLQIYSFSIDAKGKLTLNKQSRFDERALCALVTKDSLFFGTEDGNLWTGAQRFVKLETKEHRRISSAAVSGDGVVLISVQGKLGRFPVDFHDIKDISFTNAPYTNIAPAEKGFVLWRENDWGTPPIFSSTADGAQDLVLERPDERVPLRLVSTLGDKALLLDAIGNIGVVSLTTGREIFSFSSMGAMDAIFLDEKNILIGRGDASGAAPFLKVNVQTGETVSIPFPANVGIKIYKGKSGSIFGTAITKDKNGTKTVVIRLDISNSKASSVIAEYPGEHIEASFAEIDGFVTAAIGESTVVRFAVSFYGDAPLFDTLEQGSGFPVCFIEANDFLLSIDVEGLLSWSDPKTGDLLAQLYLFDEDWMIEESKRK
jgi:WD40 repeat protein